MNSALLDTYRHRFAAAIKPQGSGWNGPCPLCGGEPGKSDRFMVWPDRDENLGQTCTRHHIAGVWSCRQCGQHGDTIAYLMEAEGMTFREACGELRIENEQPRSRVRSAPKEPRRASEFTPKMWERPSAKWAAYASKLVGEAAERIFSEPGALRWLALRGLDEAAVRRYRIGYLSGEGSKPCTTAAIGRYRHRSALGLEPKTGADGRVRDKIFIPRGIVVPTLDITGTVINLRIRRHKADITERSPKYLELEGSCKAPLLLVSDRLRPVSAYFITEAELDAMLIHHVSGGVVGALAVRTNRGKPDADAHTRLAEAARVCVALDFDNSGAEGVDFWLKTYATASRWPTPEGKDPGDAVKLGVNMREWINAGLPACTKLPDLSAERHNSGLQDADDPRSVSAAGTTFPASESEYPTGRGVERHSSGRMDFCAAGLLPMGGRGNPEHSVTAEEHDATGGAAHEDLEGRAPEQIPTSDKYDTAHRTAATSGLFTDAERSALQAAMTPWMMLTDVPEDVARAYLLWRGLPITFARDGDGGWGWNCEGEWRGRNPERYDALTALADGSGVLWDWLCTHADKTVSYKNLLHYFG